jgi:thymidylate kinase
LIEITGIPGCGKSTIARLVRKYLIKSGFEVFDRNNVILLSESLWTTNLSLNRALKFIFALLSDKTRGKLIRKLDLKKNYRTRYIASNPQFYSYVMSLTNSRPIPSSHREQIIRFFLNSATDYQIAFERLSRDAIFIFDEGFVHRIVTLFVSVEEKKTDFRELGRYLNTIPRANLLIKIEADEDVCKNRIMNRKLPFRLRGEKEQEILEFLSKSNLVIDHAVNYLIKAGARAITIDNGSEPFLENRIISQLVTGLPIL